ncbi:hypothetical protein U4960_06555 [Altererythrobacter sp. H2]|uniref:hypothetical protein n=1 Tax=Altererythrobacter sp. H2 TaxID=3108391 RepID=UPI000BD30E1C|nr:hypothetical protein [Altererythrobacter sp. H2]OZA93011.1 MAG: hypothetical protein B7X57_06380 [Erythrobacter sp. 34-65-8]WRK96972.1 hypothetical protein U4960_06555 [Altererythrobacter sp. H2]
MKKIVLVAALAALSACSQSEAPAEPVAAEEPAAAPAAATVAADGGPSTGMFKITQQDGTVFTEEVRPDGTYTSTSATGETETGRWVQKSPNEYCTTGDEEGAAEVCHSETVGEDGVWTSTDPEGKTGTVERIEA